jgi:2-oxoisovalerate dehydrogenase E1 component beta subunit
MTAAADVEAVSSTFCAPRADSPGRLSLAAALNAGLRAELAGDDRVVVMGEDVGQLGGVFRVTDGLLREFGEHRVLDTPLAESGIVGTAIGMAMRGRRPVCEIQFDGFVFPAFDQIVTQLARLHYRSGGSVRMPVTIRIPYGGGIGAVEHHSESPEAYFAATPGLRVLTCSTPQDAYDSVRAAIRCDDPVILLEPKRRYWDKDDVVEREPGQAFGAAAAQAALGPAARVVREGSDATLVAYGPTVATCREAAEIADSEGRSLQVVELRHLAPLDLRVVVEAARATGRVVVVAEAPRTGSVAAEVCATVTEQAFYSLEAPVLRVGGFDTPYPPSRLERHYLPDVDRVLDAVDRSLAF